MAVHRCRLVSEKGIVAFYRHALSSLLISLRPPVYAVETQINTSFCHDFCTFLFEERTRRQPGNVKVTRAIVTGNPAFLLICSIIDDF